MIPPRVDKVLRAHGNDPSALIAILQDVQEEYRWLPEEALRGVAEGLGIPLSRVYSVATFFRAFSLKPKGRHVITVCTGTACHVRGAPLVLAELQRMLGIGPGDTTEDLEFSLETVNCLGSCALAPLVVIDGKYHGHMSPRKIQRTVRKLRGEKEEADEQEA